MSAVEEIQQAIATLERLNMLVDPAPLVRWRDQESIQGWDGFIVIGDSAEEGEDCNPVARVYTDELADLIVTLHRTIDAQLAWLRYAVDLESTVQPPSDFRAHAIALARAINGGVS